MSDNTDARWIAQIDYRSEHGTITVDHHIEEIEDLHNLVERGPDWNAIAQIRIELNPRRAANYRTLEEAALQ